MLQGTSTFWRDLVSQQYFRVTIQRSMYFNLFANSPFPIVVPVCIWGTDLILFLFESKGATWDCRPGWERCWAAASAVMISLGNPILGSSGQEKTDWIESEAPKVLPALRLLPFFFFFLSAIRERQVFLGHTKSYLKALGACISWNCLFK